MAVAFCLTFHGSVHGQQMSLSEISVSVECVVPATALTDSFSITLSADWSGGNFGLMFGVGDPTLDKPENTKPTGTVNDKDGNVTDPIPTPPTYDPNTGPHKPTEFWEPIDQTTIPVIRGGGSTALGPIDGVNGPNVTPSDGSSNPEIGPKGPSVNTDPNNPIVVKKGPHIIDWIPEDLQITQQVGGQPGDETATPPKTPTTHAVIEPKIPMTKVQFEELLKRVIVQPYTPPANGGGNTGGGTGGGQTGGFQL